MCNAQTHHELTMIGATLQSLARTGKLHVGCAARCTGKDESTIYRWISGETEPSATALILLIQHYPDQEVQLAIASRVLEGTPFFIERLPDDLDANGDGMIDCADALEKCGKAAGTLATMTVALANQMRDQRHKLTSDEHEAFSQECNSAMISVCAIRRIIDHLFEAQSRRRKARPFAAGGAR